MMKYEKTPPGPKSVLGLNAVAQLYRKKHLLFFEDLFKKYGDVVQFHFGTMKFVLLAHPEHIKHVLVTHRQKYIKGRIYREVKQLLGTGIITSEGKAWQTLKNASQPFFTPSAIRGMHGTMEEAVDEVCQRWSVYAQSGEQIDIFHEMAELSSKIVSRTLMGKELADREMQFLRQFQYALNFVSEKTSSICPFSPRFRGKRYKKFKEAMGGIDQFIECLTKKDNNEGFLSSLIRLRDQGKIDDKMLHDQILTIFFAGHETTSVLLTWTWYLLAKEQTARQRLGQELREVLHGRTPSDKEVSSLTYTQQILQETMRLFPPVWLFAREAVQTDSIGGYDIAPKTIIVLSPWVTHRHPEFWDNPDRFDPSRFQPHIMEKMHKFLYFPFSTGPRICLGNHMALQESALAIATLAQKFHLKLSPDIEISPVARGTLQPERSMMMHVVANSE